MPTLVLFEVMVESAFFEVIEAIGQDTLRHGNHSKSVFIPLFLDGSQEPNRSLRIMTRNEMDR